MPPERRRILLVEDSPVVAPFTQEALTELGCEVVGPAVTMAAARAFAEGEPLDGAIMDVHIRGEKIFAICEILENRGVPFVLTSGYASWQMPDKWVDRPRLPKPYTLDQLEQALATLAPEDEGGSRS